MPEGTGKSGSPLDTLTAKQREVLELLLQHKTSKEIAQILGISPHTVDQRVDGAKDKLGAATRGDLAMIYRRLSGISERMTYEDSHIENPPIPVDSGLGNGAVAETAASGPMGIEGSQTESGIADYRVVPEMFDGRYGTAMRIGAIVLLALLLLLVVLGGLALYIQTSQVLEDWYGL